ASGEATPGGGAAAGVAAAMAAALVAMVSRLTLGRPKYAEVTALMTQTADAADDVRAEALTLADADAAAYLALSAALALPTSTSSRTPSIGIRLRPNSATISPRSTARTPTRPAKAGTCDRAAARRSAPGAGEAR